MSSSLSCGIVGLPNVGKSTLFNALTANLVASSNYPFCTIDPNVGVVEVIDPRLPVLAEISKSKKIVYAAMRFLDIAGLVKGASKGEGLGNQFLANIRQTDAICHVVRCFEDEEVVHVAGKIDPIEDIDVINLELILADLQMADNIISKLEKQAKAKKDADQAMEFLKKIRMHLNENKPVRTLDFTHDEEQLLLHYPFLTAEPVIYATNVSEETLPSLENEHVMRVRQCVEKQGSLVIPFCAKIEEEIAQLLPQEQKEYLESIGLHESGLHRLIHAAFETLGLITFITTGEIETRAWTIPKGATAYDAAGKIHTDIQKNLVRTEVIHYDDFVQYQGRTGAKEAGKARYESKDYLIQNGDIVLFLHH